LDCAFVDLNFSAQGWVSLEGWLSVRVRQPENGKTGFQAAFVVVNI